MEKQSNSSLDSILNMEKNIKGVVASNSQGLCLGVRGTGTEESSGIWSALLAQASKLEPDHDPPILQLDGTSKKCLVKGNSKIVIALYMDVN